MKSWNIFWAQIPDFEFEGRFNVVLSMARKLSIYFLQKILLCAFAAVISMPNSVILEQLELDSSQIGQPLLELQGSWTQSMQSQEGSLRRVMSSASAC